MLSVQFNGHGIVVKYFQFQLFNQTLGFVILKSPGRSSGLTAKTSLFQISASPSAALRIFIGFPPMDRALLETLNLAAAEHILVAAHAAREDAVGALFKRIAEFLRALAVENIKE